MNRRIDGRPRRRGQLPHRLLPGTTIPTQRAPDPSSLGLHLISAAAGDIDGTDVTVFAYRADTGTRIDFYRSAAPIPSQLLKII